MEPRAALLFSKQTFRGLASFLTLKLDFPLIRYTSWMKRVCSSNLSTYLRWTDHNYL